MNNSHTRFAVKMASSNGESSSSYLTQPYLFESISSRFSPVIRLLHINNLISLTKIFAWSVPGVDVGLIFFFKSFYLNSRRVQHWDRSCLMDGPVGGPFFNNGRLFSVKKGSISIPRGPSFNQDMVPLGLESLEKSGKWRGLEKSGKFWNFVKWSGKSGKWGSVKMWSQTCDQSVKSKNSFDRRYRCWETPQNHFVNHSVDIGIATKSVMSSSDFSNSDRRAFVKSCVNALKIIFCRIYAK